MHYETPSGSSYETVHACSICHSVMWVPPPRLERSLPALLGRRARFPKLGKLRSGVAPAEDRLLVPVLLCEDDIETVPPLRTTWAEAST